jgi:hypothetical protein
MKLRVYPCIYLIGEWGCQYGTSTLLEQIRVGHSVKDNQLFINLFLFPIPI